MIECRSMASVVGRRWREIGKQIGVSTICLMLFLGLLGCSPSSSPKSQADNISQSLFARKANLEEVSPPEEILQLRRTLGAQLSPTQREPQIKIVGLKPNTTIDQTTASIRFEVEDFPIFKDPELNLGPHLDVLLDDLPYAEVYDAKQSIAFSDLTPGTHTIRVFASRPWHESVKTPSAFDRLTFHVFAPTQTNRPPSDRPLLTYSQPQGTYGAEPVLLDYILTPPSGEFKGSGPNSKVRVTVNGTSFITEEQPPFYLRGFKPGTNWVKVELLSPSGKTIPNDLSETIQLVTLSPGGNDTISKLVRGELKTEDTEQMVSLEASQRRAAQKLEDLAAPKPAPIVKTTEESAETNADALSPIPSLAPAKPEVSSSKTADGLPKMPERTVSVPREKPETVRPEPFITKPPTAEPNAAAQGFGQGESKQVPGIEAPIQSFFKRFRQPDVAPPTASSPRPKAIAPALDAISSQAENGKSASIQPNPPTASGTVTPQSKESETIPPIFELKNKPLSSETAPAIPWQKFLNRATGAERNKSAAVESPEQRTITSPHSNAADPQSAPPSLEPVLNPRKSTKP
jgi:hypothetical protein